MAQHDATSEAAFTPSVLLFDIDATLLITGHAGSRAVNRAFKQLYGLDEAMEGVRPDGKTDPFIFREILEAKLGRLSPEREIPRIAAVYLEYLRGEVDRSPGFRVLSGVRELLDTLARLEGFLVGLATGNFEEAAWIKLKRARLEQYFEFGGFGSDAENRTEVVRTAVRRAGGKLGRPVRLEAVFVIGDTPRDILHARQAGVRSVAVATGRASLEELASFGPDHLVPDLTDTENLVRIFRSALT